MRFLACIIFIICPLLVVYVLSFVTAQWYQTYFDILKLAIWIWHLDEISCPLDRGLSCPKFELHIYLIFTKSFV